MGIITVMFARRLMGLPFLLLTSASLQAQGTPADFARAEGLGARFQGKTLNRVLKLEWISPTVAWHKEERDGKPPLWWLIRAETGQREPLIDPETASSFFKTPDPDLIVDRVEGGRVFFRLAGKSYVFNRSSKELTPHSLGAGGLRPMEAQANSSAGGEAVRMVFRNRSAFEVELVWVDDGGKTHSYGKISPGGEAVQGTYEGHVWILQGGEPMRKVWYRTPKGEAVVEFQGTELSTPAPRRSAPQSVGGWTPFLRDGNLFLRSSSGERQATTRGSGDESYAGWTLRWAPDEKGGAVTRFTRGGDRLLTLIESSPRDQIQPKVTTRPYLKPGDQVPLPRPVFFSTDSREEVEVEKALMPNPYEITFGGWLSGGQEGLWLYNQRGHQTVRLIAADRKTGRTRLVAEESGPAFIDYASKIQHRTLEKAPEVIWMSQRTGWNHLYLLDGKTGKVIRPLTSGEWPVKDIVRVDEAARELIYSRYGKPGQDPYHIHYSRVNLDTGKTVELTQGDGTHRLEWSTDRKFYLDTWSRVDQPPVHELRRGDTGDLALVLGKADAQPLLRQGFVMPKRFVAKGRDGVTDIWGVLFLPTKSFPGTLPVVENIYAGPHGHHVPKGWSDLHGSMRMAELGFAVVQIDGMGTNGRSRAFHEVAWKNLADAGFPDRKLWIRALAKEEPKLDITRVGIFGGSAGGQNAMRALIDHSDLYKAAVADCGCHDNRMDKIWWNELWMGWPVDESYSRSSNVDHAHRMEGKLLLLVGELDDNVDPASTLQVASALMRAGKDFEMLVMPGVGHGAMGHPFARRKAEEFLVRSLYGKG